MNKANNAGDGQLPIESGIGHVCLRVGDLERALEFYADSLGLHEIKRDGATAALAAAETSPALVVLHEHAGATRRPRNTTGLFHVAIRLPTRRALARVFRRLLGMRYPFHGFSDHGVSEALYLADPDGNGLELYTDRPRSEWPYDDAGLIAMKTERLDTKALLQLVEDDETPWTGIDPDTDIGHVHLQVSDLAQAERFYHEVLGLDVMQRSYPGALFFAAGGYHHHVGANVWNSRGGTPAPNDTADLVYFQLLVPDAQAWEAVLSRADAAGVTIERRDQTSAMLRDSDGIGVEVVHSH